MDENKARALRVYLTVIAPLVLTALVDWANSPKGTAVAAVVAGALNVAYRRVNPFAGTSQFWRFVRIAAFTIAPTGIAAANGWVEGVAIPVLAIIPAVLETAYRQFVTAYPEDQPE